MDKNNKAVHSREFLCTFGVSSAIGRNQVVIGLDGEKVISAVRFYSRKSDGIVSVYQFAVDEKCRGNELIQKMLSVTGCEQFEFKCPKDIEFNNYYDKIGASIAKHDKKYNYWVLII